jgi:hypothetical protein
MFNTAAIFVPIIVPMVRAAGLNAWIDRFERIVTPWLAEIAGREQGQHNSQKPQRRPGETTGERGGAGQALSRQPSPAWRRLAPPMSLVPGRIDLEGGHRRSPKLASGEN